MSGSNIYVGIDLHKRSFVYVMVDESGRELKRGVRSTEQWDLLEFCGMLDNRHQVVLEAVSNSWWFVGHVRGHAGSVHVANSHRVRLIAESRMKSDRIDARILADLLRVGYLPEVYIPGPQLQEWRSLVSHRIGLVRIRASLKNRIRALALREGCRLDCSDVLSRKGRGELDGLELSGYVRSKVDDYLSQADLLSLQIGELDKEVERVGSTDWVVQLLRTIDGIGTFTALGLRAWIGEIERFRSSKAIGAYVGLAPSYRASADKIHNGPITKQGNENLRWLLMQGVNHARKHSDYLGRLYGRLCHRSSVSKARVAVAHAMIRIVYHVWKEARPYYR